MSEFVEASGKAKRVINAFHSGGVSPMDQDPGGTQASEQRGHWVLGRLAGEL